MSPVFHLVTKSVTGPVARYAILANYFGDASGAGNDETANAAGVHDTVGDIGPIRRNARQWMIGDSASNDGDVAGGYVV